MISNKMFLNKLEICFCLYMYIMFLIHGLINIYLTKDNILSMAKIEFSSGWKWIGRPQDDTNHELEYFKDFLWKNAHWYGIHLIVSESCRILKPKLRPVAHAVVGGAFLISSFKIQSLALIFLELFTFYAVSKTNSKLYTWCLATSWMCGLNIIKNNNDMYEHFGYRELYDLIISLAWCVPKCLSFGLSKATDPQNPSLNLANFLGYTMYFPVFVHGPFMVIDRYVACTKENCVTEERTHRYLMFLGRVAKVLFWLFILELSLHFFYIHYLERDMDAVMLMGDSYGLYALAYFMGQFFHIFYVITYGLGIAFASFDGLDPPSKPKCIGYINFYSDMWKYFDQGLYEFLFKHIYAELSSKNSSSYKKIFSALGTFLFVYIWHGYYISVLIWSMMNVICLILEKCLKYIVTTKWYRSNVEQWLSPANQQRLFAVLGTQIFIPSAFSNVYFFAGKEIGDYFIRLTYTSGLIYYSTISFYCYCLFQSAEFINSLRCSKK